jgi:hypothetical protein
MRQDMNTQSETNLLVRQIAALLPDEQISRTLYAGPVDVSILSILPGDETVCCGMAATPDDAAAGLGPCFHFLPGPFQTLNPAGMGVFDLIVVNTLLDDPGMRHCRSYASRIINKLLKRSGWLVSCHDPKMFFRFPYTLIDMTTLSQAGQDWRIEVLKK